MEHGFERAVMRLRDAEDAALQRLRALGHTGAMSAPGDHGEHLLTGDAVALVDVGQEKVGLATVRDLAGMSAVEGKSGYVFTAAGFTDEAVIWAGTAGVGLFVFDHTGGAQPVGRHAAAAVSERLAAERAAASDLADPVEVAALLTEGLVSGPIVWIGVWDRARGVVLELWPEPGDRDTPANVTLELGASVLEVPVAVLSADWKLEERHVRGSQPERVWVLRCRHANQPPQVVAGEAIAIAVEVLRSCGIDFGSCRIELREASDHVDAEAAAAQLTPSPVLGTSRIWDDASPTDPADPARLTATLAARAQVSQGPFDVEGLDDRGHRAWWVHVAPARALGGTERWRAEARIPAVLLVPDRPSRWFRAAVATVGTARWTLDAEGWRHATTGPNPEVAAQEIVGELSAAFATAGRNLERTTIVP